MPTHEVTVPELESGAEEATLIAWLKGTGDAVSVEEPIAEVMTDKVNITIASPATGIVAEVLCHEDDVVRPGQVICTIESAA